MADPNQTQQPEAPVEDLHTALHTRVLPRDGRYSPEAYFFLYEALTYTQQIYKRKPESDDETERHVTGQELLEGIRQFAVDQFGRLAPTVFAGWGIHQTQDFGRMVFNLVEAKMMSKTDSDTISDFTDIYDFRAAFDIPVELQ